MDKAAIRKEQQNKRARRYRERQRERLAQQRHWSNSTVDDDSVGKQTFRPQVYAPPFSIPAMPNRPHVGPANHLHRPTIHAQPVKSFWAPGLDDKTKYMMRANSLVVGFVWETDRNGVIYLSGTKVIRSDPRSLHTSRPKRQIYTQEMLQNFIFKVESPEVTEMPTPETHDCEQKTVQEIAPLDNFNEEVIHVKEEPMDVDKISQIRERLRKKKCLTSTQYGLYRYFLLRCRSAFYIYRWNVSQYEWNRRKLVSQESLRVTRASSSSMSRLRARLKVCNSASRSLTQKQMLDMVISSDESFSDLSLDSYPEQLPVSSARGLKRTGSGANANWNLHMPDRKLVTLNSLTCSASSDTDEDHQAVVQRLRVRSAGHPPPAKKAKLLKVKQLREKLRAEQDQWGYDDLSDEERMMQQSQMRARRYQYLKVAKQSKLHQVEASPACSDISMTASPQKTSRVRRSLSEDIVPTPHRAGSVEIIDIKDSGTAAPQIISIESLEDTAVQALSWEVAEVSDDAETSDFFFKHQYEQ